MANHSTSYSATTLWEEYEEQGPEDFVDWLGTSFGYEGYYDDKGKWVHSQDFGKKYGMYIPEYDPFSDILAEQKFDIEKRYGVKERELSERESKLSAEKSTLKLREDYRKSAQDSLGVLGDLGLRSGQVMKEIQRKEDISRQASQQVGTDTLIDFLGARNRQEKGLASADLSKKKSINQNRQDWYGALMHQMTQLAARDVFKEHEHTVHDALIYCYDDFLSQECQDSLSAFGGPLYDEGMEDLTGEKIADIAGDSGEEECRSIYENLCNTWCPGDRYGCDVDDCIDRNCGSLILSESQ